MKRKSTVKNATKYLPTIRNGKVSTRIPTRWNLFRIKMGDASFPINPTYNIDALQDVELVRCHLIGGRIVDAVSEFDANTMQLVTTNS